MNQATHSPQLTQQQQQQHQQQQQQLGSSWTNPVVNNYSLNPGTSNFATSQVPALLRPGGGIGATNPQSAQNSNISSSMLPLQFQSRGQYTNPPQASQQPYGQNQGPHALSPLRPGCLMSNSNFSSGEDASSRVLSSPSASLIHQFSAQTLSPPTGAGGVGSTATSDLRYNINNNPSGSGGAVQQMYSNKPGGNENINGCDGTIDNFNTSSGLSSQPALNSTLNTRRNSPGAAVAMGITANVGNGGATSSSPVLTSLMFSGSSPSTSVKSRIMNYNSMKPTGTNTENGNYGMGNMNSNNGLLTNANNHAYYLGNGTEDSRRNGGTGIASDNSSIPSAMISSDSGNGFTQSTSANPDGLMGNTSSNGNLMMMMMMGGGAGYPSMDKAPPKNPDRYGEHVIKKAKVMTGLVSQFFKDNVQRARDRNARALDLEQILADPNVSESKKLSNYSNMRLAEAQYLRFLRSKEKPENFKTIKIIGKGAFGEVRLVQRKKDGKVYALKSLIKSEMFKKDQLAHVRSERDILAESDSPWVVKLHTTFQDSTFLYMLMEFLPGGDLMTMLIKYEIFTEDITRFYMAELTLAIEAVHKLGFIHRDIKPDNILLDRNGHIKLTDFGLSTGFHAEHEASYYQQLLSSAKSKTSRDNTRNSINFDQIQLTVSNRTQINTWRKSRRQLAYSTVGTPDYIAPEIFSGLGYDYSCDWWSVGTIMFECLIGWPPFCAEEPHETYRKIVEWPRYLHFPVDSQISYEAENFIRNLICNTERRLGRIAGANEIKNHPFFRGVQWDTLRRIRAPFEPRLNSITDTHYFPIDEIDQTDCSNALRAQTAAALDASNGSSAEDLAAEMSLPFIGYTYKRFDAFRGS